MRSAHLFYCTLAASHAIAPDEVARTLLRTLTARRDDHRFFRLLETGKESTAAINHSMTSACEDQALFFFCSPEEGITEPHSFLTEYTKYV